jgi:hypothetical protein
MTKVISGDNLEFGLEDVKEYIDKQSVYQAWLADGNQGTLEDCLAALAAGGESGTGSQGPPGPAGADGKSAYQVWQDAGNQGRPLEDFFNSIKGDKGNDGQPGQDGQPGGLITTDYDELTNKPTINGTTLTSDGITLDLRQYKDGRNVTFEDIDDGKIWINVDIDNEKYIKGDGVIIEKVQDNGKDKLKISLDFCTTEDLTEMLTRVGLLQDPPPPV